MGFLPQVGCIILLKHMTLSVTLRMKSSSKKKNNFEDLNPVVECRHLWGGFAKCQVGNVSQQRQEGSVLIITSEEVSGATHQLKHFSFFFVSCFSQFFNAPQSLFRSFNILIVLVGSSWTYILSFWGKEESGVLVSCTRRLICLITFR